MLQFCLVFSQKVKDFMYLRSDGRGLNLWKAPKLVDCIFVCWGNADTTTRTTAITTAAKLMRSILVMLELFLLLA